jgi:hypothetical protein
VVHGARRHTWTTDSFAGNTDAARSMNESGLRGA